MKCLIDGDVLLHEIGWSGEFKDKETDEMILFDFDKVSDLLDNKIQVILAECWSDQPPKIFLSSSEEVCKIWNRWAKFNDKPILQHTPNFRYEVAKTKPYKGTRKNPKPFHFYNIAAYMISTYDVQISVGGLEADDEICIEQTRALKAGKQTVICSRDKDLRICPGNHYSWECGKQLALGPVNTDKVGFLDKKDNGDVYGYGLSFFLYQMIVGDAADNIPGLPKKGTAAAWKLLKPLQGDVAAMVEAVKSLYKETLGDESKEYFLEQANLLWMIQERDVKFSLKDLNNV